MLSQPKYTITTTIAFDMTSIALYEHLLITPITKKIPIATTKQQQKDNSIKKLGFEPNAIKGRMK